jgi:hypothetical protein
MHRKNPGKRKISRELGRYPQSSIPWEPRPQEAVDRRAASVWESDRTLSGRGSVGRQHERIRNLAMARREAQPR